MKVHLVDVMGTSSPRLLNLDLIRGLAALAVLAGHLRAYVFQSYPDLQGSTESVNAILKAFYFITGLGHEAVMIFFALSGFLVGGKVLSDILAQMFSWPRYLLRRLTRLWIVIIPALMLTLVFDQIGAYFGVGYDGRYYDLYSSGPHGPGDIDHSLSTLVGNVSFLQTIWVPSFGSNAPLWSLANEFWYYLIFPLAAWSVWGRAHYAVKAIGLAILLAIVAFLPVSILEYGVIWVGGGFAAWISQRPSFLTCMKAPVTRFMGIALVCAALIVSKSSTAKFADLGLGVVAAFSLPVIAHLPSPTNWFKSICRGMSEVSYTLYLTHFPFVTLIVLTGFAPTKWQPSASGLGMYLALLAAAIVWAGIVWWIFERNTNRLYRALSERFISQKVQPVNA
jgi:peptidoglycan/LPS O-acetylase OafA/YrhL